MWTLHTKYLKLIDQNFVINTEKKNQTLELQNHINQHSNIFKTWSTQFFIRTYIQNSLWP